MRLIVIAVGRLKHGPERELTEVYRKRAQAIGRTSGLREIEVIEIRESRAHDPERRRREESIAVANVVPERSTLVILDEQGESLDSSSFAKLLHRWRADDRPAICFVIGGADGLAASLRGRGDVKLAFGTATWPHQLVRVMLLEQLYRAASMLAGHPYHRS